MKEQETEFEYNQRLSNHEAFHGATSAYIVSSRSMFLAPMIYEYKLVAADTPTLRKNLKQATRGYREIGREQGEKVQQIEEGALQHELFVVPGAGMSAADVVSALQRLTKEIKKNGMWIGISEDGWVIEKMSGRLKSDLDLSE